MNRQQMEFGFIPFHPVWSFKNLLLRLLPPINNLRAPFTETLTYFVKIQAVCVNKRIIHTAQELATPSEAILRPIHICICEYEI